MKIFAVLLFITALLLFSVYFVFDENIDAYYSNYEQASRNGVIPSNTWLPAFLPTSATDIKERHNIDTNETWVFFKYKEIDRTGLIGACVDLPFEQIIFPEANRSNIFWWDELSKSEFNFYRCEQNSFMAINGHEAYFWRLAH